MNKCDYCDHVEMCAWREELNGDGCEFYSEGDQWIPVSERLPEKDGKYLVWYESGYREDYDLDEIGIEPFEVDDEGFGFEQERYDPISFAVVGVDWVEIRVVAWMPLPEPYKGE